MIEAARAELEALLAEIPEAWMTEPRVEGERSVKDIVAHITRGERMNLGVARAWVLVGSDLRQLPEDVRNAAVVAQSRGRDVVDVLSEPWRVFRRYLAVVDAL